MLEVGVMRFAGNLPGLRCGGLSNHDALAPPNSPASPPSKLPHLPRLRLLVELDAPPSPLCSGSLCKHTFALLNVYPPPREAARDQAGGWWVWGGDGGCRIALSSSVAVSALLWSCDPLPVVLKEAAFAPPVRDSK